MWILYQYDISLYSNFFNVPKIYILDSDLVSWKQLILIKVKKNLFFEFIIPNLSLIILVYK